VEYSGEEQAICCVGLAKPKPNVFLSAIQHILVLATPVEVSCTT
jgi:nuclear pore complex protein Nup155